MPQFRYIRPDWYAANSERDKEVEFLLTELFYRLGRKRKVSLLDVGFAGSGYIEQILTLKNIYRRPWITYTGLDSSAVRISGDGLRMAKSGRVKWRSVLSRINSIEADIVSYTSSVTYDVVISISVIEHIVSNEYDSRYVFDLYRDIRAVNQMKKLVKKGGFLILTFPCGDERILSPQESLVEKLKGTPLEGKYVKHRHTLLVYNRARIDKIKGNWPVVAERYWVDTGRGFTSASKNTALKVKHSTADKDVKSLCTLMLRKA